jgi:hypothetical protein
LNENLKSSQSVTIRNNFCAWLFNCFCHRIVTVNRRKFIDSQVDVVRQKGISEGNQKVARSGLRSEGFLLGRVDITNKLVVLIDGHECDD